MSTCCCSRPDRNCCKCRGTIFSIGHHIWGNELKPMKLFETEEQVAQFRKDLEDGTRETFEEIDRRRRYR